GRVVRLGDEDVDAPFVGFSEALSGRERGVVGADELPKVDPCFDASPSLVERRDVVDGRNRLFAFHELKACPHDSTLRREKSVEPEGEVAGYWRGRPTRGRRQDDGNETDQEGESQATTGEDQVERAGSW